jgi:hypothetical protein
MKHRFVFHIGPIKTGSTSIQAFLEAEDEINPTIEYKRIKPDYFFNLGQDVSSQQSIEHFRVLFRRKTRKSTSPKTCIFSHECMYQQSSSIPPLLEAAFSFSDDLRVVAYVRPQSRHYRSHFSQFLYFDGQLHGRVKVVFAQNGLTLELFTGLEAFLVALALSDFAIVRSNQELEYQNWKRMISIDEKLSSYNVKLAVGLVPNSRHRYSLIDDFCQKAGILRYTDLQDVSDIHVHAALPDAAVEFLHQAKMHGLTIHARKPEHLSCFRNFRQSNFQNKDLNIHDSRLIDNLSNYIDRCYMQANQEVCDHFGLPIDYFTPSREIRKEEIVACIQQEQCDRENSPIKRIRLQSRLLSEVARYFTIS